MFPANSFSVWQYFDRMVTNWTWSKFRESLSLFQVSPGRGTRRKRVGSPRKQHCYAAFSQGSAHTFLSPFKKKWYNRAVFYQLNSYDIFRVPLFGSSGGDGGYPLPLRHLSPPIADVKAGDLGTNRNGACSSKDRYMIGPHRRNRGRLRIPASRR